MKTSGKIQIAISPYVASPWIYQSRVAPSSTAWMASNQAVFIPFRVPSDFTLEEILVYNGATASGNIDVGIYSLDGTRIISSGSTAQSGTTTTQSFNITDTVIAAGAYYFAMAMDNTTGTVQRSTNSGFASGFALFGLAQMGSAFPLPATATLVTTTSAFYPHFAIIGRCA